MEEQRILICAPVGNGEEAVYPNSIKNVCADCGCKVWIAPSGQELKNKIVLCMLCGLKRIEAEKGPDIGILPKAAYEIKSWLSRQ